MCVAVAAFEACNRLDCGLGASLCGALVGPDGVVPAVQARGVLPWRLMLRLVSFNPLSLAKGRLLEISEAKGPWAQAVALPVVTEEAPRHKAYHFGYNRGALSNRSAGCVILLDRELARTVKSVEHPPAHLARRGGVLRLQSRARPVRDVAIIVGYYPPRPHAQGASHGGVYMRAVMALTAWMGTVLSFLPARTTPFLCVDLNDGIGGRFTEAGVPQRVDNPFVGAAQFDMEHEAGTAFREMLDFHGMSVLTTHFKSGYTFYGAGGYASRIDHVAVPAALVPVVDQYVLRGGRTGAQASRHFRAARSHPVGAEGSCAPANVGVGGEEGGRPRAHDGGVAHRQAPPALPGRG